MHKLTQINRNNFPVAPEKDIAVESFAEDNKGMIYLKEHTHIYRLSTEKDGTRTLISEHNSSIPAEVKKKFNRGTETAFSREKHIRPYVLTHEAGLGQGQQMVWNFLYRTSKPHAFFIVKMD